MVGPKAEASDDDGIDMIALAAIHEFGAPAAGIPERSFIRAYFRENEKEVGEFIAKVAKTYVQGGITLERALNLIGTWAAAQIKKYVTTNPIFYTGGELENAESTRRAKNLRAGQPEDAEGRALIDTGRMIAAISWEVFTGSSAEAGDFAKKEV